MYRINSPKVIHETIDGETVLVNLDSGNYYSMDGVGGYIWSLLEDRFDGNEILKAVTLRYAGEREAMEQAIQIFMGDLEREALVVVDAGSSNVTKAGSDDKTVKGSERIPFEVPVLNKYTDMQDLLLLDPIHDVDEAGWPHKNVDKA